MSPTRKLQNKPTSLRHYQIEEGEKYDDGDINLEKKGTTLFVHERGN